MQIRIDLPSACFPSRGSARITTEYALATVARLRMTSLVGSPLTMYTSLNAGSSCLSGRSISSGLSWMITIGRDSVRILLWTSRIHSSPRGAQLQSTRWPSISKWDTSLLRR